MIRRGFLFGGATTLLAAPAIVRVASLMQLSVLPEPFLGSIFDTFGLSPGRIHRFKGQILRHAVPVEILFRHAVSVETQRPPSLLVADYLTNESKGWIDA